MSQEFGLTAKGFRRKRYADIIAEKEARARALFGENVNLSEASPLGQFIRLNAWEESLVWEMAEDVYNAAYVDTSTGIQLDRVAQRIGIRRRPAQRATGAVVFLGDDSTEIPAGFRVATGDDIEFETTEAVTISGGTATAPIRAVESSTGGNVPANTVTEIINPTAGIDSVTNPAPTSGGRNKETDAELRERYLQSVARGGASTIDSIRASLLDTPGVRAALVAVNNTMEMVDGRPPKSFECYVLGGDPEDVARTILETGAAGIQPYGTEQVTVKDASGQDQVIGFTYAVEVDIHVRVTVTKTVEYPLDGDGRIRTEIIKHIGGADVDGQVYTGLGMGDDVVYTRLIKTAYRVPGIKDVEIEVSTDGAVWVKENIEIALTQVAETNHELVVVTSE